MVKTQQHHTSARQPRADGLPSKNRAPRDAIYAAMTDLARMRNTADNLQSRANDLRKKANELEHQAEGFRKKVFHLKREITSDQTLDNLFSHDQDGARNGHGGS